MRTRPSTKQSGAALVEFALVISILILLLAGTYEFGRAFAFYDALSKGTRDAARYMSVAKKANINSSAVGNAKAIVVAAANAAKVPNFTSSNVVVTCLDASYNDSNCVDGTAPGGVRVEIRSYNVNIGQTIPLIGQSMRTISLTPHTTMRYML
ncbi:pilus assembly protein [Pseudoduganella eburnea]|uniref:Pilus assembly protein n=1 Tax=Massilia eburnea TaxID=1776165 RepID=A0A6L6QGK6_9BURK|nr:TadE/TadG family type IV pilus assembly protein [Massilia eburnea]MTW11271.1 pilus assembly protein [Massilia eburnea]